MCAGPTFPVQHGGFMYFELHLKRGHREWEGAVCFCDGFSQAGSTNSPHYIAQTMQLAGRGFLGL